MPLIGKTTTFLNIPIKECTIKAPSSTATPISIYIYQLPILPIKLNTSLAEFYLRQEKFGYMHQFTSNYYIDNLAIWQSTPPQGKIIRVTLCGDKQRTYKKAIKLIGKLANYFNISFQYIKQQFINDNFYQEIKNLTEHIEQIQIEEEKEELLHIENEIPLKLIFEAQEDNFIGKPINKIRIESNIGEIVYRVWSGGAWWPWTSNGEWTGGEAQIEGFQYEATIEKYELEFRIHILNDRWTPWKTKTISIPYNKPIDSIEIRVKEGEL